MYANHLFVRILVKKLYFNIYSRFEIKAMENDFFVDRRFDLNSTIFHLKRFLSNAIIKVGVYYF